MDRNRFALIFGPILGLILLYLILSAMFDRVQSDQIALGDLGPVTMEEVSQNPALQEEAREAEGEEEETVEAAGESEAVAANEEQVAVEAASGEVVEVDGVEAIEAEGEAAIGVDEQESAVAEAEEIAAGSEVSPTGIVTATEDIVIAASVTETEEILAQAVVAENIVWYALQIVDGNGDMVDVLDDSAITALFSSGTMSGSTVCSNYTGRYTANEDGLFTVELTATAPAGARPASCEDGELAIQEANYLNALTHTATYEASESTLDISDADGNPVLSYEVAESN